MSKRMRYAAVAAILIAVVGGLAVVALPAVTDVGAPRHDLRSYDSGAISKVRVAHAITLYVDQETRTAVGPGLLTGMALVAMATACAMTSLVLTAAGAAARARVFYAIAAAGLAYLGFDELGGIHETIGHNLPFLADLPGVDRPDDVVFASYLIPTAVVAFLFRDVLTESPLATKLFAAGIVAFVVSAVLDVAGSPLDNPSELLVSILLGAGLVALMAAHLTPEVRRAAPPPHAEEPRIRVS